jgi:hypothetical protein
MQRDDFEQVIDLDNVIGGAGAGGYTIGGGVLRGFVDSLRGLHATPNRADGQIVNNVRGYLPPLAASRPRPWIGGQSINTITRPMRIDNMQGFPATR